MPPDARFCHKCGKPQFDLPEPELEPVQAPIVPPGLVVLPETGFQKRSAIRSSLLAAVLGFMLILIPLPFGFDLFWKLACSVASGFLAVVFYTRRTGQSVTARNGARMGWFTGLFIFLLVIIMMTAVFAALTTNPEMQSSFRQQLAGRQEAFDQVLAVLQNPASFAMLVLVIFMLFTVLCTAGGALGAKVLEKE